jgi:outer membrane immunogenic protein
MRRLALSALGLALTVSSANAAGPLFSNYDWQGFWIGGYGAPAWENTDLDKGFLPSKLKFDGGLFGYQSGYNFQTGNLVIGYVSDFAGVFGDSKAANRPGASSTSRGLCGGLGCVNITTTSSADRLKADPQLLSSLRARLGYSFGGILIYGTGGIAWGDFDFGLTSTSQFASQNCIVIPSFPCTTVASGQSRKHHDENFGDWGVAYGGGTEFALTHNLTGQIEYLHLDFGDHRLRFPSGNKTEVDTNEDMVRFALNLKFNVSRFLQGQNPF